MKPYARMMVMLVCVVGTALILQGMFDASDHQKAERAVRSYRGGGGQTIEERVQAAAPRGAWSSEITHACRGFVRVRYDAPNALYEFDYDVPQHLIHPGNGPAEQLLGAIPLAPDGGAPRD